MEVDPSSSSPGAGEGGGGGIGSGGGDLWPFDSLTTSLLFSSVSASPQPLPASSSSWLTPPSPLWLFDERQLLPLDMGAPAAPATAPPAEAAAVVEEVHRTRSGEPRCFVLVVRFFSCCWIIQFGTNKGEKRKIEIDLHWDFVLIFGSGL